MNMFHMEVLDLFMIYIHKNIDTYIYTYIHAHTHTYVNTCMRTRISTCVSIQVIEIILIVMKIFDICTQYV
jgi:hypothetical protein